jgi:molybdopterin synthase sulfur carrier subunit
MATIRLVLPYHLRILAGVSGELTLEVPAPVTLHAVLETLEARFPVLRGTIRDPQTRRRRPLIRFFACQSDLSHQPLDEPLPEAVALGEEPLWIVGALAGG